MSDIHDSQRAAFDDDRLLDYALGLEDDPELAAALSRSARLRERLADLKSDLAAIETELRRAIPPVDASYAEPDASRWSRLRRSFGEGEVARRRPLRGRRLATSLVAAALAAGDRDRSRRRPAAGGRRPPASSGSSKNAEAAQPRRSAGRGRGSELGGARARRRAARSAGGAVALKAAAYRDVAVVRAGPLRGAGQSFTVMRVLKGNPPASFSLVLNSIGSAPLDGSLAIAYLHPVAAANANAIGDLRRAGELLLQPATGTRRRTALGRRLPRRCGCRSPAAPARRSRPLAPPPRGRV